VPEPAGKPGTGHCGRHRNPGATCLSACRTMWWRAGVFIQHSSIGRKVRKFAERCWSKGAANWRI